MRLLHGEKIYLKLVEKKDLEKRVEWINDPEVQNTLNFDYPTSLAKTEKWFDKAIVDPTRRDFSVFMKENDEYIGFGGFINIKIPVMKGELYVAIGDRNYWHRGIGSDIYKVLMEYGFTELGLNKIYGYQLTHNAGAHKAVEKLGWQREGLLRQEVYSHGSIKDTYIVSILKEDWHKKNG